MTFGQRLRELRKAKGMNQKELADKVGIDFTYLSKLENDRMSPPREKYIVALAKALEADSDELLGLAKKLPSDLAAKVDVETIRWMRSTAGRVEKPED